MAVSAKRVWFLPNCPPAILANAPEGYGDGTVAYVVGGTIDNIPPTDIAANLGPTLGLTEAAAATAVIRYVPALLWTIYWDPTGQAIPPPTPE